VGKLIKLVALAVLVAVAAIVLAACGTVFSAGDDAKITLDSITIVSVPNKTVYVLGETLDVTGLKVDAVYSSGISVELSTNDLSLVYYVGNTEGKFMEKGSVAIIVKYKDNPKITAEFTVLIVGDLSEIDSKNVGA